MKNVLLTSVVLILFFVTSSAYANDTLNCQCHYYSSYKKSDYINKFDSIKNAVKRTYGNVIAIGKRSFSEATTLFIFRTKGTYKGFFYNFNNASRKVVSDIQAHTIANKILQDTTAIINSDKILPQRLSHDFSFFVSFEKQEHIYEICYSQVLIVRNKSIGKLFIYYLENFN